jgi:hypothetical protein
VITLDMWKPDGFYYPTEQKLREVTGNIKGWLQGNGIDKNGAIFQLQNEPAKKKVPVSTYCWQANIIKSVLGNSYDLSVGGEEVSYRSWYNEVVSGCNCDGIAYHLQSCAGNIQDTDSSVEFIANLAKSLGKKTICTESSYVDPSKLDNWNLIKYHIKKADEIGSLGCLPIFVELRDHPEYKWLSFKYGDEIRSPYYNELLNMSKDLKEGDMKLDKIYQEGSVGIGVRFIQLVLNDDMSPEPLLVVDGIWGPKTNAIVLAYQEKHGLAQYNGAIGPNTMQDMIKQYPGKWDITQYLWSIGVR